MLPGWSMSQCIVSRNPSARARANTAANLDGGLSRSSESSPTATIQSLYGSASISVAMAKSADRSRRKHMISSPVDAELTLCVDDRPAVAA